MLLWVVLALREKRCLAIAFGLPMVTASRGYFFRVKPRAQGIEISLIIVFNTAYTRAFRQVLQTFACEDLPEVGKRYLRADFSIECDTATHRAYQVYAAVMIALCECTFRTFTQNTTWLDYMHYRTLLVYPKFRYSAFVLTRSYLCICRRISSWVQSHTNAYKYTWDIDTLVSCVRRENRPVEEEA